MRRSFFVSDKSEGDAAELRRPEGDNAVTEKMQAGGSILCAMSISAKLLILTTGAILKLNEDTRPKENGPPLGRSTSGSISALHRFRAYWFLRKRCAIKRDGW